VKRTWVAVLLVGLLVAGTGAGAGQGAPERLIVTLKGPPAAAQAAVAKAVERSGGQVLYVFDLIPAVTIEVPAAALNGLLHNPNFLGAVQAVEVDQVVTAHAAAQAAKGGKPQPPQPPAETLEWGVDRIDAEKVWDWSPPVTGQGVKVCIIDTGIDDTHPDLAANVKGGVNFVMQKGRIDPAAWKDDNGHGTHVAGIVGARRNGLGVVGVAPEVSLYAAKVLNKNGMGYASDVIAGINWAVNNGMDVVNMSLGQSVGTDALKAACDAAVSAGVVLVASAGNEGDGNPDTNEVSYPAAYESVIAVGATDSNDNAPRWSSSGPAVELAAPGVNIRSTWKGGGYATLSGTSMAAPHVTGTVALVLAIPNCVTDPNGDGAVDVADLRMRLCTTADFKGPAVLYGSGLVDAEEAVTGTQTDP
jgi:subtilisin